MLAMGATLEPKDLRQVLRTKKRGVVAGWCSQSGPWAAPERVNVTRVDSSYWSAVQRLASGLSKACLNPAQQRRFRMSRGARPLLGSYMVLPR